MLKSMDLKQEYNLLPEHQKHVKPVQWLYLIFAIRIVLHISMHCIFFFATIKPQSSLSWIKSKNTDTQQNLWAIELEAISINVVD